MATPSPSLPEDPSQTVAGPRGRVIWLLTAASVVAVAGVVLCTLFLLRPRTTPLAQLSEAYTELERRHTHGKILLKP